jgi:hypothetical protein
MPPIELSRRVCVRLDHPVSEHATSRLLIGGLRHPLGVPDSAETRSILYRLTYRMVTGFSIYLPPVGRHEKRTREVRKKADGSSSSWGSLSSSDPVGFGPFRG